MEVEGSLSQGPIETYRKTYCELEQFGTLHEKAFARLIEKLPNLRSLKLRKLIAHGSASLLGHYEPETRPLHLDRLDRFIRLTTLEIAQIV